MTPSRARPDVSRIAVAVGLAGAIAACGDRAGPERRSSDVAAPARVAREETCVVPGQGAGATTRWRIRDGDTPASIARRCYGDERLWTEVVRANPSLASAGAGTKLRPGGELVLPDVVR